MAESTRHTPLEALLLFLYLRKDGIDPTSFTKASETLEENEFVKESGLYNSQRLRPEALKQLYLDLLKEEVRLELVRRNSPVKEQDYNPRKRKLSTPPLRSVNEAAEHVHLVPQVVNRLYVRYRDHTVRVIKDGEDRYSALRKDVEDLERPDWPLAERSQESSSKARGAPSIQSLLRNDSGNTRPLENGAARSDQQQGVEAARLQDARPVPQPATPGSPVKANGASLPDGHRGSGTLHSRTPSGSSARPMYSPLRENFQPLVRPPSRSHLSEHVSPYPPITPSATSPNGDSYRRLAHPQAPVGGPAAISPRMGQTPRKPPDRTSGSPIILPPVPGMLRSNGPPSGSLDPSVERSGQAYRPNPQHHSPHQAHAPIPSHHPNQLPQPRGYVPQGYQYPSQYSPPHYPPSQGQMPPYPPQPPAHSAYSPPHPAHPQPVRNPNFQPHSSQHSPYPPYYGYPVDPNTYYQPNYTRTPRGPPQPPHFPHTPVVPSTGKSQLPKLSPTATSGSATKWKKKPSLINTKVSLRPSTSREPRAISPISPTAPSPEQDLARAEGTPSQHSQPRAKADSPQSKYTRVSGRGANPTRANRPQPSTSPAPASGVTSPSLPPSLPIKSEPLGTPIASSPPPLRPQRRSTPPFKRKRPTTASTTATPSPVSAIPLPPTPTPPATHVLASRNFARTSAPIMNEITSHKFAGMFAKALSEREAPGYKNLVYQPQNLKSIKSAISAGSRAVAAIVASAATAADDEDGGAGGGGAANAQAQSSQIWVELDGERGADVVPPRGIVNSAQLEREVMRMFANAVMFNPDERRGLGAAWKRRARGALGRESPEEGGGVARDTRDMAEAVEKGIGVWRSAERRAGEMEEERGRPRGGGGGDGEEGDGEGERESVLEETVEVEFDVADVGGEVGRRRKKRKTG